MRKDHLLRSLIALFILVSLLVVTALIARAAVRDVVVSEIAWMGTLTPLVQPGIILTGEPAHWSSPQAIVELTWEDVLGYVGHLI